VTHPGPHTGKALEIRKIAHKCLKRTTEAIERLSFNTAIAGIMEAVNALYDPKQGLRELATVEERAAMNEAVRLLSFILVPFVPHFANELAQAYGATSPLEEQSWPAYDPALVIDDVIPYAVQVMGKLRAEIMAPLAATEAEVRALAEANENVSAAIAGKTVKKFVFVPRRLVNFVVG
jgi:leucyl-tRNA synthetase